MYIAGMILGCLLVGQSPDALVPAPTLHSKGSPAVLEPAIRAGADSGEAAVPAKPAQNRMLPPEMVAGAMTLPAGSTLTGQPWTLLSVLGATPDRRQQLELTRAYWHLAQAVGEYHFCSEHARNIERLKSTGSEPASLRLARASAAAMLRQAELEATRAQCELARLARLPADAALPLPADRPHVGPYRTNFQEMFAGKAPPEPTALMERILPIRRQAVDEEAAAVQAAEDVLAAALDDQNNGRGDAAVAAACAQDLVRQQRAFLRCVCDYNRNIAEYGLAVASPTASPQALVAILIGPAQQGIAPVITADERGRVQPAGANLPAAGATSDGWRTTEPTLAPPRDSVKKDEARLAPSRDGLRPVGKDLPPLTPPDDETDRRPATSSVQPLAPLEPLPSSSPQTQTVKKPASATVPTSSPLYSALLDVAPGVRAKQLAVALHWDRSLPEGIGKPMSLADCLLRDPGADRRATIGAYWRLRQRTAEYQVLVEQAELLEALAPAALDRRSEPSGPMEMLRLHRAQLAAKASVREAHVALVEAQYALAMRVGATTDAAWPLASTVPHSGNYLLMLDSQPQAVVQSWPVRRLAATIPACVANVQQQAAAVVEADAARAAAAEKYRAGGAAIDQAIDGVAAQTQQSLAMLAALTDYNQAIAEYVLTVMPPTTPANRLVAALVVKP